MAVNPLSPSRRLLLGPGPTNVAVPVLEAMARPMLGHLDEEFHGILTEVVELLGRVYQRTDGLSLALSATGTGGLEAGLTALVEPGDTIVVGVAGFFGDRVVELARRHGATVVEVRVAPGEHVPTERILDALRLHPAASLVAVVHADTSTGVRQPIEELTTALRGSDVLVLADCVTSLGGIPVHAERWGLDYCFSCTQKCLGAPPGMSPVSLSERGLERIRRQSGRAPFYYDFELLARYWVERPMKYHHTVPVLQVYALHEALRLALEEGLENRWRRHAEAGAYLQEEIRRRGLELLADPACQLPQLTAVRVPPGIDGKQVQRRLVREFALEIGGSLSAAGPPIWRIGLMGVNAAKEAADRVLEALDAVLQTPRSRRPVTAGARA